MTSSPLPARHRMPRGVTGRHAAVPVPSTTFARYVGRVGALAFALGVGAAIAATQPVASADSTSDSTPGVTRADSGTDRGP
jgi:hypothetical protein